MNRVLRVGLVGAGWVTQYHLPAWSRHADRAQVVAICDPRTEVADERAAAFGIDAVHADAAQMIDAIDLDVLDICSPRETHVAMVQLGVRHGLAVICQKPLAPDFPSARQLISGIEAGYPLMVHENWRFRPQYRQLKAWIDQGLLGEIRQVELGFHSSGMIVDGSGDRPALVRQPFFRGLQRLLVTEILIHHIDTLRYLLGELALDFAHLARSADDVPGEDVASIVLHRTDNSAPVTISGNLALHGAPPVPVDWLCINGSEATARFDGTALTLTGSTNRSEAFVPDASYHQSYENAIGHFLDGLDRRAFETSTTDNLRTLELVEDIYRLSGFENDAKR